MNLEIQKRKDSVFSLRKFIFETQEKYEKQILKSKSNVNDLVTKADLEIETKFREEIVKNFPGDSIIGEEFPNEDKNAEFVWYIDPIDGTHPYTRGIKEYGTMIGLTFKEEIVFGVIFFSEDKKAYWAIKGEGALCEKEKISVINRPLKNSSIAIQIRQIYRKRLKNFIDSIGETAPIYARYAAAWYFIALATGKIDALQFMSFGGPWDSCAGNIIAEEAGAIISPDLKNLKTEGDLFAATPEIYEEISEIFKK